MPPVLAGLASTEQPTALSPHELAPCHVVLQNIFLIMLGSLESGSTRRQCGLRGICRSRREHSSAKVWRSWHGRGVAEDLCLWEDYGVEEWVRRSAVESIKQVKSCSKLNAKRGRTKTEPTGDEYAVSSTESFAHSASLLAP